MLTVTLVLFGFFITLVQCAQQPIVILKTQHDMYFCFKSNSIQLSTKTDRNCHPIKFNIHTHNNGLVFNFNNDNSTKCKYMCMDTCNDLYHDNVFYEDDCVFTTMAFNSIDTLSINRGNYSDFIASYAYYFLKMSLSSGARMERLKYLIEVKLEEVRGADTSTKCSMTTSVFKKNSTKICSSTRAEPAYDQHANYGQITIWDKLLSFLGLYEIKEQKNNQTLRYYDYKFNYIS
ncbi:fgf-1 [Spodoptera litura granulovirus]|uniref:Fgf-1 n=1 Tax=Spodoptera litura granulovirus TaxID=359919 RepID=A5IZR8_9BBAC|nr:fgf-1 [Spodoptera litura granulovirus]ABQ52009.1 fgf-1 [Spodoptera litura granulovirus]